MEPTRRNGSVWVSVLLALAGQAGAQQAAAPPQAPMPAAPVVQTLEEVHALPPDEEETLDLYRFNNPIQVDPNHFNKSWSPPPSPKEISEGGGYLLYGLGKLVGWAAKDIKSIPGVRGQIQPAVARPPPLNQEQMDRAARIGAAADEAATASSLKTTPHE